MAYLYEAWETDGPKGEVLVASFRSDAGAAPFDSAAGRAQVLEEWKQNPRVVRITRTRTEMKSEFVNLWLRPGYVDPFLLPEELEEQRQQQ